MAAFFLKFKIFSVQESQNYGPFPSLKNFWNESNAIASRAKIQARVLRQEFSKPAIVYECIAVSKYAQVPGATSSQANSFTPFLLAKVYIMLFLRKRHMLIAGISRVLENRKISFEQKL